MGIISKFFEALLDPKAATWSAGVSFNRSNPLPLDKWSVFQSMADATAYAESNAVAYPGQVIAVYNNGKMVAYVLSEDVENAKLVLEPIGVIPTGNGAISVSEDGVISIGIDGVTLEVVDGALTLVGFDDAPAGAQLVKASDGTLSWVKPDLTTVQGLETTVKALQQDIEKLEQALNPTDEEGNPVEGGLVSDVKDLEDAVGEEAVYDEDGNLVSEATGIFKDIEDIEDKIGSAAEYDDEGSLAEAATGLYAELDKKANASDVYTKEETDNKIAAAITDADHLSREIVENLEAIDPNAAGADKVIYMVPTGLQEDDDKYDEYMVINGSVEKVGSWEVNLSAYATTKYVDDELAKKVDAVDGSRLMTDAEGTKLANVEAGAQKNYISSVDTEFKVENGKLSLVEIAQDKISGLVKALEDISQAIEDANEAIDGKVDASDDSRLITLAEAQKLAAIKDLIQSVDTDKFTVDENGKLLLNSIEISEVEGLVAALANKVEKVEGSRLLTAKEAEKLEALSIDESGQVGISGTVSASNVQELYDAIVNIVTGTGTGMYDKEEKALLDIEAGAEKNYINGVNSAEFTVDESRVLSLKAVPSAKVEGLTALSGQVTNLNNILNGYTDTDGAIIKGVVGNLNDLKANLEANYVTKVEFNSTVSNLNDLISANAENIELLTEQVNVLDEHLTWKNLDN